MASTTKDGKMIPRIRVTRKNGTVHYRRIRTKTVSPKQTHPWRKYSIKS